MTLPWSSMQEIPEDVLTTEVRARYTCVDCKTIFGDGWHAAGLNRVRCGSCQKPIDKRTPRTQAGAGS